MGGLLSQLSRAPNYALRRISPVFFKPRGRFFGSGDFDRIYHVHIRKCGGTSVNKMFLSAYADDVEQVYLRLARHPFQRISLSGIPFVGWNKSLIEHGAFGFAFSHTPFHQLCIPDRTYTFTLLRDPVDRVVSHYRMIVDFLESGREQPFLETEGHWAQDGFDAFLDRTPRQHLANQLYMFDADLDPIRAIDRMSTVSNVKPLNRFNALVSDINAEFATGFSPLHTRKSVSGFAISPAQRNRLEGLLSDELRLLEMASDRFFGDAG